MAGVYVQKGLQYSVKEYKANKADFIEKRFAFLEIASKPHITARPKRICGGDAVS
ncbi:MAG: hypothetical protein ACJAXY_000933 [Nonlabens sp.]|jgi:hypothetical protein